MSLRVAVIGGGHNGLIAALHLAREGASVVLLERRSTLGGVAGAWEFGNGYRVPGLLNDTCRIGQKVLNHLKLKEYGLILKKPAPTLIPGQTSGLIELSGDELSGQVSSQDREAYAAWQGFLGRVKPLLLRQLSQSPPSLEFKTADLWELGTAGFSLRALGKQDMLELVRVLPMAVADWLREHFQSETLCAALALPALFGSYVGPRAAGTAINLLVHQSLSGPSIQGGSATLIALLSESAQGAGVEIQTGSEVQEILIQEDRVTGVRVDSTVLEADVVVATCDPLQALTRLINPFLLTVKQSDALRSMRSRGVVAKVHLALEGGLELDCRPDAAVQRAFLGCETIDRLERAMDPAKYGDFSRRPVLDVRVFSPQEAGDPADGSTLVSISAYGAPFGLRGGWTSEAREEFLEAVLSQIEGYSSSVRKRIRAAELVTPADLSDELRLPGGHLCHLEHSLDQFASMRPVPFASGFTTPISGLFLAGSGCHPGGGLTGLPGFLGAKTALEKSRRG